MVSVIIYILDEVFLHIMRIDSIDVFPVEIPRTGPFRIATGTSESVRNVVVRISSGEFVGWGASAPNSVTGETIETIANAHKVLVDTLRGSQADNPSGFGAIMDRVLPGNPAAKASIDIALYDLLGKTAGKMTCDILGAAKDRQLTDVTIGIDSLEGTLASARKYVAEGFRALKLKVGLDLDEDLRRVEAVRETVGSGVRLWVDANQGYTVDEAIDFCLETEHLGLEFLEQPVKRSDLTGLGKVKAASPVPIMADEAVMTSDEAQVIARMECADMINIKLMKCGGIAKALEIARISKDHGMANMIGCMGETEISIAGALHFALSSKNVVYADLDSHFMLSRHIAEGMEFVDGCLYPSSRSGLGLKILQENF
jgi:L-alanine-DL-glutamate epimerase-like enolase superfamily enzyme